MELKEARRVAKIVETAEGGCGGCINEAARELNKQFPAFDWTVVNIKGFHASIDVKRRKGYEAPLNPPSSCLNLRPGYKHHPVKSHL